MTPPPIIYQLSRSLSAKTKMTNYFVSFIAQSAGGSVGAYYRRRYNPVPTAVAAYTTTTPRYLTTTWQTAAITRHNYYDMGYDDDDDDDYDGDVEVVETTTEGLYFNKI